MQENLNFEIIDSDPKPRRRSLLPVWIKIFIWIFFLFGGLSVFFLIFGSYFPQTKLSIYGFETYSPYSPIGIFIILLFTLKGTVSFGLWFEKDWGPKLAIFDGVLGCFICLAVMFILPFAMDGVNFTIRLELLALVPYIIRMMYVREKWN